MCFPNLKNVMMQKKKLSRTGVNNAMAKPGQDTCSCSHTLPSVSLLLLLVLEDFPLYPPYPYFRNSHPSLVFSVRGLAVVDVVVVVVLLVVVLVVMAQIVIGSPEYPG